MSTAANPPNGENSCDNVLAGVERREKAAEYALWQRFDGGLVTLIRRWYRGRRDPVVGEEQLALDVIDRLCNEIRVGKMHDVHSWDELWSCARHSARFRFVIRLRRKLCRKRNDIGPGGVGTEATLSAVPGGADADDDLSETEEELVTIVRSLGDAELSAIVRLRLLGCSTPISATRNSMTLFRILRNQVYANSTRRFESQGIGGEALSSCASRSIGL